MIAAIAITIILLIRRRKRQQAELEAQEKAEALERENRIRPMISHPIGGELAYNGLHELAIAPKRIPEMDGPFNGRPSRHGYNEIEGCREFYGKYPYVNEANGSEPVFEMAGSDVHEMSGRRSRQWSFQPSPRRFSDRTRI